MNKAMARLAKLEEFLKQEREISIKRDQVMKDAQEFDRNFNNWVQDELGIKDDKRNYHMAEIMKIMLETSIGPINRIIT